MTTTGVYVDRFQIKGGEGMLGGLGSGSYRLQIKGKGQSPAR